MVMAPERDPIVGESTDRELFRELERMLAEHAANRTPRLVGPGGEEMELPQAIYRVLVRAAHELASGNGISILPVESLLTTQQTADLLNISRPHLIKMLEAGEMPYRMVGTHRRIKLHDVLAYRRIQDEQTEIGLTNLARLALDTGTYDAPAEPEH